MQPNTTRVEVKAPESDRRTFLKSSVALTALAGCATVARDDATLAQLGRTGPSSRVLLTGGTIVSMDPKVGDLSRGDILIEGARIAAIGPSIDAGGATVIDAADTILIPGFVDTHRHAWLAAVRGLLPNADLGNYMAQTHRRLAHFYTPEDMYIGNLMTSLGCLEAGITCLIDNSHNSRTAAHSDAAIKGLADAGIRAVHASGAARDGQWNRQWPADIDRLRKQYFTSEDQLLTLGMYADLSPELLAFARERGLRVSTELSGFAYQGFNEADGRKQLGPWMVYNHCTGLPDIAWRQLRDTGGRVNMCPRSDAQYLIGEGLTPIQKAIDAGLKPALSVDGETSYSTSMFTEMSMAFMMQRAMTASRRFAKDDKPPAPMSVRAILACATINGAECAGLEAKCGSLAPGKQADIVMIRTDGGNTFPLNNALATVVNFAEIANVDTVIVGGRVRKYRGKLVDVDAPKLQRELLASRDGIFARAGYKHDMFAA